MLYHTLYIKRNIKRSESQCGLGGGRGTVTQRQSRSWRIDEETVIWLRMLLLHPLPAACCLLPAAAAAAAAATAAAAAAADDDDDDDD